MNTNRFSHEHSRPVASHTFAVYMPPSDSRVHRKRERPLSIEEGEEQQSTLNAKRQKTGSWNYPKHVWDNLSKITLTRKALGEFDRRTREACPAQSAQARVCVTRLLRSDKRKLEEFCRNGGPDLTMLRGVSMTRIFARDDTLMGREVCRKSRRRGQNAWL